MSNKQGIIYSGAVVQGTEWMDWSASLHTSETARQVMEDLEKGLATVFGSGSVRVVVSDLADIDMPIACGASRAFEGGATLAEAMTEAYGIPCGDDTIVALIDPHQLEYLTIPSSADLSENEHYWDSVLHYATECVAALVDEWMSISIRPAAMMTVAQTLPVSAALKNKICFEAIELFCQYYLGHAVELQNMEDHYFDRLEKIQPMTGTIVRSIITQKLRYPHVAESDRNILGIVSIAHALHTTGGMSMMPVDEMARA